MDPEKPLSIVPEDLKLSHDGYFRETFQVKRIARSFLRRTLSKKTRDCLDLRRLTVEPRHQTDDIFKEAIADVVYRVPIKGIKEHVNFFVVVEHKSYQDFLTIFQLWGYVYRICRREFLAAMERGVSQTYYRLPPVVAIIIHHGESKFQGKTELAELFLPLPGLEDHLPKMQAILFDLNSIADDDPILSDSDAPELKVVLMVLKCVFRRDVALKIKDVLEELKPHSDDPATRRLIRATWVYLANNAKHLKRSFDTLRDTIQQVTGEKQMPTMVEIWKAEGLALGRAAGKAEGKAEMILTFLRTKFRRVPKGIEKAIRQMTDPIALDSLAARIVDCPSLDEFAKELK